MLESIFLTSAKTIDLSNLLLVLTTALGLGFMNSLAYLKFSKHKVPTQSFVLTLVMLPAVVAVIILLVGSNVASAFSLAGALSIIRFRSEAGEPKDLTYILLSMAIGLACGSGYILYGAVVAVILCGIMIACEVSRFGQPRSSAKTLRITIPENLNFENVFDEIMERYALAYTLTKVRTTELGSLYELVYEVIIKESTHEKEFIDELRCRNGNMSISLTLRES